MKISAGTVQMRNLPSRVKGSGGVMCRAVGKRGESVEEVAKAAAIADEEEQLDDEFSRGLWRATVSSLSGEYEEGGGGAMMKGSV